jgi:hypothetical protein
VIKNLHYRPIYRKLPFRIFSNMTFWNILKVPNNIPLTTFWGYFRYAQMWSLGGLVVPLFKALPVKI